MFSFFSRLRKINNNKIIILLFHRVSNTTCTSIGPMSTILKPGDFEEVISIVSKNHQVLAIDEAVKAISTGINKNSVVITFDDGYRDTYTEALPILEKYQVSATVYITSGFISRKTYPYEYLLAEIINNNKQFIYELAGKNHIEDTENISDKLALYNKLKGELRPLPESIRHTVLQSLSNGDVSQFIASDMFMDWPQLKKLTAHPLITIGAHTYSHMQLDLVSTEEANTDIGKGVADIENNLGMKVGHFAYPYGGYDEATINLAAKNNFKSAVTTKPDYISRGKTRNYLKLPRVELSHKDIGIELQKLQDMFST